MRERTQKQGVISRCTALHLDKPPLCCSFLFKGRASLHHSQPRRRNSGKTECVQAISSLLRGAGQGTPPDDNFQGRKNETELFWLCLQTAEQQWKTAPREMPREKRMFCCVGFSSGLCLSVVFHSQAGGAWKQFKGPTWKK